MAVTILIILIIAMTMIIAIAVTLAMTVTLAVTLAMTVTMSSDSIFIYFVVTNLIYCRESSCGATDQIAF